jgi:hypothetical protein
MMRQNPIVLMLFLLIVFFAYPLAASAFPAQGQIFPGHANTAKTLNAVSFQDINNHWARDAILRMALQGILRGFGDGSFRPEQPLQKEEALAILVRLAGQSQRARELAGPGGNWADGYLSAALAQGIITAREHRELMQNSRRQPAERQEVGVWAGRALGLTPVPDVRQVAVHGLRDRDRINPAWLPLIEAVIQEGILVGIAPGIFGPQEPVTRAQMAVIGDRINPRFLGLRGIKIFTGELLHSQSRDAFVNGRSVRLVDYMVLAENGQVAVLQTGPESDFVVTKNQAVGLSAVLAAGEHLRVFIEEGRVIQVEAAAVPAENISALLRQVDIARQEVFVYSPHGFLTAYRVGPQATISIGGRQAGLRDLLPGQEILLSLKGDHVVGIKTLPEDLLPAYRPPQHFVVTGRLREIGARDLILLISQGEETYRLIGTTQALRQGRPVDLTELRTGENLRLLVNQHQEVLRIEAEGPGSQVTGIFRGRLEQVNLPARQAVFSRVYQLVAGAWQPQAGLKTLELARTAEFFSGSRPVPWTEMARQFRQQEIYMAVVSPFGRDTAVKLTARTGESEVFNGMVQDLSFGQMLLELRGTNDQFHFGPGTIVIKNRRLVDPADLSPLDHLFLIANRERNLSRAAAIITQTYLPGGFQIARGVLSRIREEDFSLNRYSFFRGMQWQEASAANQEAHFSLSGEAKVLDAARAAPRLLSPAEFRHARFTGEYLNHFIYLISRNDRAVALAVFPSGTAGQTLKTSLGRATALNEQGILRLEPVQDWSEGHQRWLRNPIYLSLDARAALVLQGARMADTHSLQAGAEVLVLHDHQRIYVAAVQE